VADCSTLLKDDEVTLSSIREELEWVRMPAPARGSREDYEGPANSSWADRMIFSPDTSFGEGLRVNFGDLDRSLDEAVGRGEARLLVSDVVRAGPGELGETPARLRLDHARLGSSERIQEAAARLGLVLPAPGEVRYRTARPTLDARRAARRITEPAPAPEPVWTAPVAPATPAPTTAAPTTGTTPPAATGVPAPGTAGTTTGATGMTGTAPGTAGITPGTTGTTGTPDPSGAAVPTGATTPTGQPAG